MHKLGICRNHLVSIEDRHDVPCMRRSPGPTWVCNPRFSSVRKSRGKLTGLIDEESAINLPCFSLPAPVLLAGSEKTFLGAACRMNSGRIRAHPTETQRAEPQRAERRQDKTSLKHCLNAGDAARALDLREAMVPIADAAL